MIKIKMKLRSIWLRILIKIYGFFREQSIKRGEPLRIHLPGVGIVNYSPVIKTQANK